MQAAKVLATGTYGTMNDHDIETGQMSDGKKVEHIPKSSWWESKYVLVGLISGLVLGIIGFIASIRAESLNPSVDLGFKTLIVRPRHSARRADVGIGFLDLNFRFRVDGRQVLRSASGIGPDDQQSHRGK